MKIRESFVSSFQYKPPADPEKLLYDFYFLIGYASPGSFDKEEEQYAVATAIEDCVNHLQKHMLSVLKFALTAEFRHYRSASDMSSQDYFEEELAKMPPIMQKFIFKYEKEMAYSTTSISKVDPRSRRSDKTIKKDPFLKGEVDNTGSARSSLYVSSYKAVLAVQKKLGMSEYELAETFFYIFDKIHWGSGYGGKAWAEIAKTFKKLITSTSLQEKIVWIDHAYDLQHNTGTVFNKLKKLYDKGGFSWIARALDWKRDQTDLRKFYYKVSTGLKPLVGFIAYRAGVFIEDLALEKEALPADPSTFSVGDFVKVQQGIRSPKYQWGQVNPREVGVITEIHGSEATVNFPSQYNWHAYLPEMEKAEPQFKLFKPGDFVKVKDGVKPSHG